MSSIFTRENHLFLNNPRGGVEDVAAMKAAGFAALFCNVADFAHNEWSTVRQRAAAAGVVCGPWARVADQVGGTASFNPTKLSALLEVASSWGSPVIVNAEAELKGSGSMLTTYIRDQCAAYEWALSMEAWPYANVEWWPLAAVPVLPQVFKGDPSWPGYDESGIRQVWQAYGIECVPLTFGSYGDAVPADYDRLSPYGVYTADTCNNSFAPWSAAGATDPCKHTTPDPGGEMAGVASSAKAAWEAWLGTDAKRTAWERDNPGEWSKLQSYNSAPAGAPAPTGITSSVGKMLLSLIEARRYGDGTHA